MRPKPFKPEPTTEGCKGSVRDPVSGLLWHRCEHRPLYADTDRSQVVYHANYLRYFELGRAWLMRDFGFPYAEVEAAGYIYPIVDMRLRFFRPLLYDELMAIHTRPATLERVRVTFDYIITHGETGAIVCKGYTRHCALSESWRPTAVDPHTVRLWEIFG